MRTAEAKYIDFTKFLFNYKLPTLTDKLSDTELVSLYQKYSPHVFSNTSELYAKAVGTLTVWSVVAELQRRYPNNVLLQHADYTKPLDLQILLCEVKHDR